MKARIETPSGYYPVHTGKSLTHVGCYATNEEAIVARDEFYRQNGLQT